VDRAALGQVSSQYFGFPCHSFSPPTASQSSPSIIQGWYNRPINDLGSTPGPGLLLALQYMAKMFTSCSNQTTCAAVKLYPGSFAWKCSDFEGRSSQPPPPPPTAEMIARFSDVRRENGRKAQKRPRAAERLNEMDLSLRRSRDGRQTA
jgi:hypothetical protein